MHSFFYKIPWKSQSIHYGNNRGIQNGLDYEFKKNIALKDYPDPRRIDLYQTIRDPYEEIQVKVFSDNNKTTLFAVCDLSSSMQFNGKIKKISLQKSIVESIALSASEMGDEFRLIAYKDHVINELLLTDNEIHDSSEFLENFGELTSTFEGSTGILEAPQYLTSNKAIIFWISDFHLPIQQIEQSLNLMSQHMVIPLILWDESEFKSAPRFGFSNFIDPETGSCKAVLFRPSVKEKLMTAFATRRKKLESLFASFGIQPIFLENKYEPQLLSDYFHQI